MRYLRAPADTERPSSEVEEEEEAAGEAAAAVGKVMEEKE